MGDRIQFTAPANELKVANRELGTIDTIEEDWRLRLKMESGRTIDLDPREHLHLDHGYAMTSHSSQGQTADRVLIHVDTKLGAKDLLNSRMAYVSVSRGRHDAQIYTNMHRRSGKNSAATCPIRLRSSKSKERTRWNHKPRTRIRSVRVSV